MFSPQELQQQQSETSKPSTNLSLHTVDLMDDATDGDDDDTASCTSSASSSFCSVLSAQSCLGFGKKKVRFQLDENNDDLCESKGIQYYDACHDLTPEDISNAWWSREERRAMKTSVSEQCQNALWNQPKYRRAALRALSLTSYNILDMDVRSKFSEQNMLEEDLQILVHGDVRGLERQLFARLQLPRRNSKVNIEAVLRTQELFHGIPDYNDDEKIQLIADQYAFNSNFAKKWARTLAEADEKDTYREPNVEVSC